MQFKRITIFLAASLLAAISAPAQSPDQLAEEAAKAYNGRQYAKAIELYEKIQKEHVKSNEARDIDKYIEQAKAKITK